MMKRARKVSYVHGEVHFKQKQRLSIAFTGNTLPHRKHCVSVSVFVYEYTSMSMFLFMYTNGCM